MTTVPFSIEVTRVIGIKIRRLGGTSTIKPKTRMDVYNRFLFAFCSVHTTWQSNIKGYLLLRNKFETFSICEV